MRTLLAIVLCICGYVSAQRPAADVVVLNGNVYTVDSSRPKATALAIIGDRIVAVGSTEEMDAWRGAETKVIDAEGKLVLPGFNDSHVHLVDGSATLFNVRLKDAKSPEEFAKRISEHSAKLPKGEWVLGGDWDDQGFDNPQLPTRQMIDAVTPDRPVFVNRYDGHMALANSYALKLAGITAKTKAPAGGEIVRDAKGEPTGILKDAAMNLVYAKIPPMGREQKLRVLEAGMQHAASLGVTSVQDMNPSYADIAAYSALADKGALTLRIYAAPLETRWEDQAKIGITRSFGTAFLRIGALKGYADGSLGSTTAYFFEPYMDAPKTRGLLSDEMHPVSAFKDRLLKADAANLQLCTHAIGDQAISIVLDIYADIIKTNGARDRRLRIEHSQHVHPKDFARYAKLGVIASVQPYHAIDDGRWADKRIGVERGKSTYAFRSFIDSGVRMAFGTDWYVAPLNPMETIYAAVTRATLDGKRPGGWFPEQKITVAEAIEAYTMGSAYAEFQDKEKGSLAVGKLADLVILSDDIFSMPKEQIRDVRVLKTMVGGKLVYERQ